MLDNHILIIPSGSEVCDLSEISHDWRFFNSSMPNTFTQLIYYHQLRFSLINFPQKSHYISIRESYDINGIRYLVDHMIF